MAYGLVIVEPAARFGDADRWPCGIIFSFAWAMYEYSETSQVAPFWRICKSFGLNGAGRDVALVTVMLGQDASGAHVDATFLLFSPSPPLAVEKRGKYSLG